ncbi:MULTISPECIES: flagellar hook-associated protein FlgL [Reinekea]|jgi:flagellar hook-associated protein 3 FlgL|uniref:Flagellar hook-associated protein FlgL n=1 Tax=Reinekea forsetii TaxID=1336806 RepID=A0A2K8KR98_9GAMM|nr:MULTISPECIES: flagellar hook-associated protein FlgL [Reinekea]ATX77260.1 flagellar hook-associated protein FlgL [Reinekea forsetii]MDO7640706.1 flagellar hook-associated protein FlgL [Reinekea forsetii]MDO7646036.1 flagellar hook-associated protein FlgL [Reinekea forsetii]
MADRISSYWVFNRPVNDMMRLQSSLNRTQEQISSGQGILSPSDDPVGAARVMQLDQEIALVSQYERNITLVTARLEQEEGVLAGVTSSIQRIRELTVQAGNAALYSDSDRIAIAQEVNSRVQELFNLTNSKDGSGEYLFSGFAGDKQSFVQNPGGGYLYQGDEGVRYVQVSRNSTVAASDTGKDAFLDIPANVPSFYSYGNSQNTGQPPGVISQGITVNQAQLTDFFPENAVITFGNELDMVPPGPNITVRNKSDGRVIEGIEQRAYKSGDSITFAGMNVSISGNPAPGDKFLVDTSEKQGLLVTVEKLAYALENFSTASEFTAVYDEAIFNSLENLDAALENVSQVRTRIGARINTTDNIANQHADNKLAAQDIRSSIGDLDYAEAVSRLQMEEFILKAAQQTFATVTKMSLFDFIR